LAGRGDIDRLLTEWRSLLRQIANAPPLAAAPLFPPAPAQPAGPTLLAERWDSFRALARDLLGDAKTEGLPDLPPLTADQRRVINHRFFRAPEGRPGAAPARR
jgi:hypothetical protein